MPENIIFTLTYIIISVFLIYPPIEFISAGFTIPALFSAILGSEIENFVLYHIKRTIINVLVYSCLPLGYILLLNTSNFVQEAETLFLSGSLFWEVFFTSSLALPLLALYVVWNWTRNDYKNHPIALNVCKFSNNSDWKNVASDINREFRSIDKITIQTNPLVKIIATENWILKTTPFTILIAHQSDTRLIVKETDIHDFALQNATAAQFLNIEVKSTRPNIETFTLRINVADFKDLEDRIARDITILPNVKFHKTVIEQFVDVFKTTIAENPKYKTDEDLDQCIGCMQTKPNVKLQKLCGDNTEGDNSCGNCFCRPMWCADCMAKWFASRQESDQQNMWLGSKCTCPMCRARFCVLDVSMIE